MTTECNTFILPLSPVILVSFFPGIYVSFLLHVQSIWFVIYLCISIHLQYTHNIARILILSQFNLESNEVNKTQLMQIYISIYIRTIVTVRPCMIFQKQAEGFFILLKSNIL